LIESLSWVGLTVYCLPDEALHRVLSILMWLSPSESEALHLSLSVAVRSVALSLPLANPLAWLLTRRRFLGHTLLDAFVHLPLVLPPVVVGYLLLVLFGTRGPVGSWLERVFGIELIFTRNGAALATAVMSFPLMVRAMRISLENVDRGLEDAARTLGAGTADRFATITLPLMLPGVLAGAITAFFRGAGRIRRCDHLRFEHSRRNAHPAPGSVHRPANTGRRYGGGAPGRYLVRSGARRAVIV